MLSKNYNFKKLYSTLQHGLFEKDFFQVFSKCFQPYHFEELFNYFYQNLKFGFDESIQQKEDELKQLEEKLDLINKNANNEDIPDITNISLYSENIKELSKKIEKEKDKFELEIVVSLFKLLTFFSLKEDASIIKNIQSQYGFSDKLLTIGFIRYLQRFNLYNDPSKCLAMLKLIHFAFKFPLSEIQKVLDRKTFITFKSDTILNINRFILKADKTDELKLALIKLINNPDLFSFYEETEEDKDWRQFFHCLAELGIDIPINYIGDLNLYLQKKEFFHLFEDPNFLYQLAKKYAKSGNKPNWLFKPLIKIISNDLKGFFIFVEQELDRFSFPSMFDYFYDTDFSTDIFYKDLLGEANSNFLDMFNLSDLLPLSLTISDNISEFLSNDQLCKNLMVKLNINDDDITLKKTHLIKLIAEKIVGSIYHHLWLIKTVKRLRSKTELTVQEKTIIENYHCYIGFINDFLNSYDYTPLEIKAKEVKGDTFKMVKANTDAFIKSFVKNFNEAL